MTDIPDSPSIDVDDLNDPQPGRTRQFENHDDIRNDDPNSLHNQKLREQDDLLLPGSEPGGMEIHGGMPLDEDDGGLEGIHPNEDDEIDNSGRAR